MAKLVFLVSLVHGGLAHLGERLICIQEVAGSSPVSSTKKHLNNSIMIVPPHRSIKHYKLMKDSKSSSSVIDNFLSTEEIQYLYKWWQDHRYREKAKGDISQMKNKGGQVPKGTALGNLRYSYAYEELKESLQPKIQKALGTDNFRALPGNFYYVREDGIGEAQWNKPLEFIVPTDESEREAIIREQQRQQVLEEENKIRERKELEKKRNENEN